MPAFKGRATGPKEGSAVEGSDRATRKDAIFLKFDGEIKKATSHVKLGGFDQDTKVLRKG